MYWELNDSAGNSKLVIIGLDSGKSANLDGHNDCWQICKRRIYPDHTQHIWLDERLRKAPNSGSKVIILFHIPTLTRDIQVEEYLSTIHQLIADYSCVKLVLCGHDHNHQQYTSEIFRRYIEKEEAYKGINKTFPDYIVNGGGGAFLQSTDYKDGLYKGIRYPSRDQWKIYANFGRQIVSSWGRNKSLLSKAVAASFDAGDFGHVAFYDEAAGRIEMHLEALRAVDGAIDGVPRRFAKGERIHTENSYKYRPAAFDRLLADAGFTHHRAFLDPAGDFAVFYAG